WRPYWNRRDSDLELYDVCRTWRRLLPARLLTLQIFSAMTTITHVKPIAAKGYTERGPSRPAAGPIAVPTFGFSLGCSAWGRAAGRDVPRSAPWLAGVTALLLAVSGASLWAQDTSSAEDSAAADDTTNAPAAADVPDTYHRRPFRVEVDGRRMPIVFRKDVVVRTNETAETVVVIGGSAIIHGKVREDVVVIGGDIELDGSARDVVAVLGGIKLGPGAKVEGDVAA